MTDFQTFQARDDAATVFAGSQVALYVAMALRSGLKLYASSGIKPNRLWTPKKMLKKAEAITGQKFKRYDYASAIVALNGWIKDYEKSPFDRLME